MVVRYFPFDFFSDKTIIKYMYIQKFTGIDQHRNCSEMGKRKRDSETDVKVREITHTVIRKVYGPQTKCIGSAKTMRISRTVYFTTYAQSIT